MKFKSLRFTVDPVIPGRELLLASLEDTPVESVEDTEDGLIAYVLETEYRPEDYRHFPFLTEAEFNVELEIDDIETINWNEEWEKHFDPVRIENQLLIRAEFHKPDADVEHEIVIRPKMAFGTGHHATTAQICKMMLEVDWHGKSVLDMGTGTGILAILARKLGSGPADAIDVDTWSTDNTREHLTLNNISEVRVIHGDVQSIPNAQYDVIIANINRNVLLDDLPAYIRHLSMDGTLFLSGFMEFDEPFIREAVEQIARGTWERSVNQQWVALKFNRNS